jgi:hypothetical protein
MLHFELEFTWIDPKLPMKLTIFLWERHLAAMIVAGMGRL